MSDLSVASLYCAEEADDVDQSDADTSIPLPTRNQLSSFSDESFISRLLDSESHYMPLPDYLRLCADGATDLTSRQDSINWIFKVHAHYQFKPVTAYLSVNYIERFLSSHSLPESGWPFQLLSVACLSLAAKMEEPYVPLLLELQILEPRFVFDPKIIQKMELRVMATLKWRLHSVTPFDYLHYFISKLSPPGSELDPYTHILSTSSDLIVNTTRAIDFLGFPPSVIAAAAVITAAGESVDSATDTFHKRTNKESVRSCHQLMEEYLVDTCPSGLKVWCIEPAAPPSPVGVLDASACASCDTVSDYSASVSVSSEAEPENKPPGLSAADV
ncbi:Cyclin-D4-1 [Forsythia ovata]|uniref:Cyclin-D4-1 n=1 Tax=Forsythia ovata TaxID=205694 RepID=A0ABD1QPD8_9LAMI